MQRTWKPVAAGIIGLIAGIPVTIFYPIFLIWVLISGEDLNYAAFWVIPPLGLPAILGGILALRRRVWWLSLFATILGICAGYLTFLALSAVLQSALRPSDGEDFILIVPFIGAVLVSIAAVLVGLSRGEFKRRRLAPEG